MHANGTITMPRVLVKARIYGINYVFDSAFKEYETIESVMDIGTASGYNRNAIFQKVQSGKGNLLLVNQSINQTSKSKILPVTQLIQTQHIVPVSAWRKLGQKKN